MVRPDRQTTIRLLVFCARSESVRSSGLDGNGEGSIRAGESLEIFSSAHGPTWLNKALK